jgi:hypothetical protein
MPPQSALGPARGILNLIVYMLLATLVGGGRVPCLFEDEHVRFGLMASY